MFVIICRPKRAKALEALEALIILGLKMNSSEIYAKERLI